LSTPFTPRAIFAARSASISSVTRAAKSHVAGGAEAKAGSSTERDWNRPPEWQASTMTTTFTPVANFARSWASSVSV